jgi:hypothetical protein
MTMLRPPGLVDDFERRPALKSAFAEGWDAWLGRALDDSAAVAAEAGGRFRRPHASGAVPQKAIAWDAFPKALTKWYEGDAQADELRWRTAEIPQADPVRPHAVTQGRVDPTSSAGRVLRVVRSS